MQVDGNNLLEVHRTLRELTESMRKKPRPVLLECMTFRMRGHEEASGVKYVPKEMIETWAQRDPVLRYEEFLMRAIWRGTFAARSISRPTCAWLGCSRGCKA